MTQQEILKRDKYTCQKCGYNNLEGEGLEIHHINPKYTNKGENIDDPSNLITLCSICHHYAPDEPTYFKKYVNDKIDGKILDTFRNSKWSISERTTIGMNKKAKNGFIVTKPPIGYILINKKLTVDTEKAEKVKKIYETYLNTDISLTQLAKANNLTTSGLIKLLQNKTYLGKVKFGNEYQGTHTPIIEQTLFNMVQEKLTHGNNTVQDEKRIQNRD